MRQFRVVWMFGPRQRGTDAADPGLIDALERLVDELGVGTSVDLRENALISTPDADIRAIRTRRWRRGGLLARVAALAGSAQARLFLYDVAGESDDCRFYAELATTNEGKFGETKASFADGPDPDLFFAILAMDRDLIAEPATFDESLRTFAREAGARVGAILVDRPWLFSRDGGQAGPSNALNNLLARVPGPRDLSRWTPSADLPLLGTEPSSGSVELPVVPAAAEVAAGPPASPTVALGPRVYDKAKWHLEGDWPPGLAASQANVHIGLYLAWLVLRDLVDPEFFEPAELKSVKQRRLTGPALLDRCDGVLAADMLTPEGNAFTASFYLTDQHLAGYIETLAAGLPSPYHVKGTWTNFDRLRPVLDSAFEEWRTPGH